VRNYRFLWSSITTSGACRTFGLAYSGSFSLKHRNVTFTVVSIPMRVRAVDSLTNMKRLPSDAHFFEPASKALSRADAASRIPSAVAVME
jgi:hypothetical protein